MLFSFIVQIDQITAGGSVGCENAHAVVMAEDDSTSLDILIDHSEQGAAEENEDGSIERAEVEDEQMETGDVENRSTGAVSIGR